MTYAPVAVIGFHREHTLRRVLSSLHQCEGIENTPVYVFVDQAQSRDVDAEATREMVLKLKNNEWPKLHLRFRAEPLGCFENITSAVSELVKLYGRTIVIEDDMLVSRTFIEYMNTALDFYASNEKIWCINAYQNPYFSIPKEYKKDVYLAPHNQTGGWATWKDRWENVDFEMSAYPKVVDTEQFRRKLEYCSKWLPCMLKRQFEDKRFQAWDVVCTFHMLSSGLYAVEPRKSLTKNIGYGPGGLHTTARNIIFERQRYYNFMPHIENLEIPDRDILRRYGAASRRSRLQRVLMKFWAYLRKTTDDPI